MTGKRVALFLSDLSGGGVQRMTLVLARGLQERGYRCELILARERGPLLDAVPPGVAVTSLPPASDLQTRWAAWRADPLGTLQLARPVLLPAKTWKVFRRLPGLALHLRKTRPDALIAATTPLNLMAVWARKLAGVPSRLILTERTAPSLNLTSEAVPHKQHLPPLIRRTYRRADAIVAVSSALGDDLASFTGLPRRAILTIYNPVVGPDLARLAAEPLDERWFADRTVPVILGVGRLSEQKDFPTLIRAFAHLRRSRPARLLILGGGTSPEREAAEQEALRSLAAELGVAADLQLQGFVPNPFRYYARASLFALSSRYEGLANVLIEAMACGCPVVSTDCPAGPREILEDGRWGPLVPVGDPVALAAAMAVTLDQPPPRDALRARANRFSVSAAVDRYAELVEGGLA